MCRYRTARRAFHKFFGEEPPWNCWVCKTSILVRGGHSSEALAVHHRNGDTGDNSRKNLKATHIGCHLRYHNSGRSPSELNRKVSGEAVAASNKRRSGDKWMGNQHVKV